MRRTIAPGHMLIRGQAGLTLVEIMVSLAIILIVVTGMTGILVHSSRSSDRTQSRAGLDSAVALAGERVEGYLMEARSISIDADGLGVTYKYPPTNTDGTYVSNPSAVETTSRRLYLSGGVLYSSDEPGRPILSDVPDLDPDTGTTLQVFSVGVSGREVRVRLASEKTAAGGCEMASAATMSVRPRNMPQP